MNTWGAWESTGDGISFAPAVFANSDGRLQFFIRGTDRKLYSRIQGTAGGAFTATWYDLGGSL